MEILEQAGGAADVEALLLGGQRLFEQRPQRPRGTTTRVRRARARRVAGAAGCCRARGRRRGRSGTASPSSTRPGSTGSAKRKTRFVTLPVEVITTTITTCGWSSSTSTWRTVARPERRRRDEREQPRQLGEHLGGRLQRGVDLVPGGRQVEREAAGLRVEPLEQPVGVVAVAALGRDAAGRGVRVREQPEPLELGELAAHRRRRRRRAPRGRRSVREPTGCRVATYSSTTPRRIARCRLLSSISAASRICRDFTRAARR